MRFTDKGSATNLIKVMTDGILLAEMQTDRLLKRYDTLIVPQRGQTRFIRQFIQPKPL